MIEKENIIRENAKKNYKKTLDFQNKHARELKEAELTDLKA
jgi:hypothetical protein